MSGLICWFSVGLMLYFDVKLGLLALALTIIRALSIISISLIRLYYESRHFDLQGKISGFVLQLFAGIAKLRVAARQRCALSPNGRGSSPSEAVFHLVATRGQCSRHFRNGVSDARDDCDLCLCVILGKQVARRTSATSSRFLRHSAQSMGNDRGLGERRWRVV